MFSNFLRNVEIQYQTSVILGNVQVLKSVMKSQVGNIYLDRFPVAYQLSWQWQLRTC